MSDNKLIYKELSYQIVGVLFDVFNELGPGYEEKTYELAVAKGLEERKINYLRQVPANLIYKGEIVGRFFLDFLIDDLIVLEIKVGTRFSQKDFKQVLNYLKATSKQLAILAIFSKKGIKFIRLLNINDRVDKFDTELKLSKVRKLSSF